MTTLLLFFAALIGSEQINTPEYLYSVHADGTADVWECSDWQIHGDGRWARFKSNNLRLTHEEFLQYFVAREGLCNLHTLGALAEKWKPPVHTFAPEPDPEPVNPPVTLIYYLKSVTSKTYHLPNCRYVNALMVRIEDTDTALLSACKVCKPDDINSILKCFLQETQQ